MPKPFGFWIKTSRGKSYEVVFDDVGGISAQEPLLLVDSAIRGKALLVNWLHEGLHSERPDLTESEVIRVSEFLGELLWRAGYRSKKVCQPYSGDHSCNDESEGL